MIMIQFLNYIKKSFLSKKSHKFMHSCILNYNKLLKYKFENNNLYKYNTYPKLIDVIKFKFTL